MATDGDAEKLRKQIEVLSSLIHTQRELKKKDISTNEQQSSVKYSWKKSSTESESKGKTGRNELSHQSQRQNSKTSKSFTLDRRKNGNVSRITVKAPAFNTVQRKKSTEICQNNKLSLKSKQNIELLKPSVSIENTCSCSKPVLPTFVNKDTKHSRMIDHKKEDTKISRLRHAEPQKATYVKTSAASTSLLSARLSSLSSSLAAAKSKLNLESTADKNLSSKEVKKSLSTISNSSSRSLESLPSSPSSKDITSRPSTSSSYLWTKPQSSEPGTSNSVKIDKPFVSSLKWTKPVANKDQCTLRNTSNSPLNNRSLSVKTPGRSIHVWRSQHSLKLDRRKRSSFSKESNQHGFVKGFIRRRQKMVMKDTPRKAVISRYCLVNAKRKKSIKAEKSNKIVVIEGIPYRSSANKLQRANQHAVTVKKRPSLTLNLRGEKFMMDVSGKTLTRIKPGKTPTRMKGSETVSSSSSLYTGSTKGKQPKRRSSVSKISIGGVMFVQTEPGVLVRSNEAANMKIASGVVRRSVQNAIRFKYKKNVKAKLKSEQYCMFYNRFGKCNKGEHCPYIHDATKIAVCTKFLQGKCKNTDGSCSFSHKIDKDKMPVCQFFLKGNCTNDNCQYSHVNVSNKAAVCQDFIKGYCINGQQCKKKHILNCEEFSHTGKCSKGRKCNLIHRERKVKKRNRKSSASRETKRAAVEQLTEEDGFLPLEQMDVSTEQDLSQSEAVTPKPREPIAIKPRFLINKEQQG